MKIVYYCFEPHISKTKFLTLGEAINSLDLTDKELDVTINEFTVIDLVPFNTNTFNLFNAVELNFLGGEEFRWNGRDKGEGKL